MSVAEARPAATVVVIRTGSGGGVDVLLVRRNDKVAFMAGAYVFPGGRVDEIDKTLGGAEAACLRDASPSRFTDLSSAEELPYRVAAVREIQEEAAVTLTIDALIPIAHWVTPQNETRRYDTRFFLASMPDGQTARHDEGEMTALLWVSPAAAIEQCRRGAITLPPPTWTTLKQLTRFDSMVETLAWARTKRIARVEPRLIRSADRTMLTLPGDSMHPTVPDWEVPEDTRFVLEEGKGWKPVRA
jgi:8-oxo-dGTP pyrophosphatase MutT (NUDIX family)